MIRSETEFVWFFGASGSGKKTLVHKAAEGELPEVTVRLDTVPLGESFDLIGRERRPDLYTVLGELATSGKAVLIKGQTIDLSELRFPQRLCEEFPDLLQRIVFVYVSPDRLPERVDGRRDAFWRGRDKEFFIEETRKQINLVKKVATELNLGVSILNNSGSKPVLENKTLDELI